MAKCKDCLFYIPCLDNHRDESVCSNFEHKKDFVEVVRCKSCTQWCRNCGVVDSPNGHCYYHEIEMNGFDFCSYGERREGE